tara:strand:- start:1777 stop:2070 length:294 start_codon:yes stop_codon:yes gene_type:complete
MIKPKSIANRLPLTLTVAYLLLFLVAVPWYWGEGGSKPVLGMPLWAVVSIGVSFLISCLTAWAAFRAWPSDGLMARQPQRVVYVRATYELTGPLEVQ